MTLKTNRRRIIKSSAWTVLGLGSFHWSALKNRVDADMNYQSQHKISADFPKQDASSVREVVAASHGNFDRVKQLVSARPELAKAVWDWGYGDWESAIGAASHMGRPDIAEFLIDYGARPNLFTFAMLGKVQPIRSMVQAMPGIQRIHGPHGITLLNHASFRLDRMNQDDPDRVNVEEVLDYLLALDDADLKPVSLDISEKEQQVYYGKYSFGEGKDEYFEVTKNRAGRLFISRGEMIGRVLHRVEEHAFAPGGAPSVRIRFEVSAGEAQSLVVHDPGILVKAVKK